jgi:hypothetical protein
MIVELRLKKIFVNRNSKIVNKLVQSKIKL